MTTLNSMVLESFFDSERVTGSEKGSWPARKSSERPARRPAGHRSNDWLAMETRNEESFSGLQIKTPLQFGHGGCHGVVGEGIGRQAGSRAGRLTDRPSKKAICVQSRSTR